MICCHESNLLRLVDWVVNALRGVEKNCCVGLLPKIILAGDAHSFALYFCTFIALCVMRHVDVDAELSMSHSYGLGHVITLIRDDSLQGVEVSTTSSRSPTLSLHLKLRHRLSTPTSATIHLNDSISTASIPRPSCIRFSLPRCDGLSSAPSRSPPQLARSYPDTLPIPRENTFRHASPPRHHPPRK